MPPYLTFTTAKVKIKLPSYFFPNSNGWKSLSSSCSLTVGSKQKIKIETQNIMVSLYPLKVSSTQNKGVPFSSCFDHGVQYYYISMTEYNLSSTDNSNLIILVELQRLYENDKCVSTGVFALTDKKLLCLLYCSTVFYKIISSLQQRQQS